MFEWLCAYPSKCRGDLCCALPLSVEVILVERGVVYSQLYLPQILSVGSMCGKSCVDELVEILLCEGRDVNLCAQTSKHILVFVFDPLSVTLSLSLTLCIVHIVRIIYMLGLIVCPYLCLTKSEPEFTVKGSKTTPLDSSKLRLEVVFTALLVQHKCGHTQTILSIYMI